MSITAQSVIATIEAMERYFRGGHGWGRFALHNPVNRKKCIMGAVQSVRASNGHSSWVPSEDVAAATYCIRYAIAEKKGCRVEAVVIENFNDTRLFFGQIAEVLTRAKQVAMMRYARQLPPPSSVPQVPLAQSRPALAYQPEEDHTVRLTMNDLERVAVRRPAR